MSDSLRFRHVEIDSWKKGILMILSFSLQDGTLRFWDYKIGKIIHMETFKSEKVMRRNEN